MTNFVKPTARDIERILIMMYGDGLKVGQRSDVELAGRYVATFVADDDSMVALCACDLPFVGYSGAALTMVPAAVAKEMIAAGKFNETILENFYEVMNICSKLYMSDSSPHLRLKQTLSPDDASNALGQLAKEPESVGFDIEIPRYGSGSMVFLVT